MNTDVPNQDLTPPTASTSRVRAAITVTVGISAVLSAGATFVILVAARPSGSGSRALVIILFGIACAVAFATLGKHVRRWAFWKSFAASVAAGTAAVVLLTALLQVLPEDSDTDRDSFASEDPDPTVPRTARTSSPAPQGPTSEPGLPAKSPPSSPTVVGKRGQVDVDEGSSVAIAQVGLRIAVPYVGFTATRVSLFTETVNCVHQFSYLEAGESVVLAGGGRFDWYRATLDEEDSELGRVKITWSVGTGQPPDAALICRTS